jgi:heat shock protein HslJ
MNIRLITSLAALILVLGACNSTKTTVLQNPFSEGMWELEYISGSSIAFEGLFPNTKPAISFNATNKEVRGTNSCNGYWAKYSSEGQSIVFGEPGPTTMMYCGEGEKVFLETMSKVNKYNFDSEGKLQLLINEVPMMRFKKQTS